MKKLNERIVFKKQAKINRDEKFREDISLNSLVPEIATGKLKLENFIYGKDIGGLKNSAINLIQFQEELEKINKKLGDKK